MSEKIKIDIIKASKYFSIDETHAYLKVLNFPTDNDYGKYSHSDYVSQSISSIDDEEKLKKLLNCYEPESKAIHDWKEGYYRIFISHRSEYKKEVSEIKDYLLDYGLDLFVAHEDINVSVEWRDALIESLNTMDCLVAYITNDFSENDWCSQEVGFAAVNKSKVIPLRVQDTNPKGFLGFLQAGKAKEMSVREVSNFILEKLLEIDREKMLDCLVNSLNVDAHYGKTGQILEFIINRNVKLNKSQYSKLEDIYSNNDQVSGYYHSEKYVGQIKKIAGL
jgi:hypothetical protein